MNNSNNSQNINKRNNSQNINKRNNSQKMNISNNQTNRNNSQKMNISNNQTNRNNSQKINIRNNQTNRNNSQKMNNSNNSEEKDPYKRGLNQAKRNLDRNCKFSSVNNAKIYAKKTYLTKKDKKWFGLALKKEAKQFIKGYSNGIVENKNNPNPYNNNSFWYQIGGSRRCTAFTCEGKRCKRVTKFGNNCSSHC
jgi:hypothetical protein